jgi:translation initiation factor 1
MRKNLFEMGALFDDNWTADNKEKPKNRQLTTEIKSPEKHQLHFTKEKRRGKVVTIVQPFYLPIRELKALLKMVKKKLGTGGTLKENYLEFQGDVQTPLQLQLEKLNYKFKK